MLELKHISKSYTTGDFIQKALDDISVTFRNSEFVAVLGPSGSGKTTMLNVIGGLTHYDSGDLLINGKSTKDFADHDWDYYRNNQVGFVFQNYDLIPHQTILSNVELALTLSGISPSERKKRATQALKDVGLADHVNKKPNQLSGGQMQRVAIARAIVNNPSIIFADEPTGALDTKTSKQIMEILKDISKDKLVIMVTHNAELANDYATRIVNLKDAKIVGDSQAFDAKKEKSKHQVKKLKEGKTAMSFLTALSLSFANLMGKKGRTFLTAFAGSIGIIGIAGILALSTGTNDYIKHVENNTLSQYPLQITRSKSVIGEISDIAKGGGGLTKMIEDMRHNNQEDNKIGIRTFLSKMLITSGNNDLKSLKTFLDSNPDKLSDDVDSIEYAYSAKPIIYANDASGIREVYPAGTFSSVDSSGSSTYTSASQNNTQGGMSSMSGFFQLPKNDDLYKDKYSIAAGRWPQNPQECVLVLHQDGTINDALLYTLGLRDNNKMLEAIQKYSKSEKVDLPEEYPDINYSDVLGRKFKSVYASDIYTYSPEASIWMNNSEDKEYMKNLVDKAEDLTIVGIIQPPEGNNTALVLNAGINFPFSLSEKSIAKAAESQIVKDQLSKPNIDVLTNKTFEEEKSGNGFDMSTFSKFVEINPDAFAKSFNFDTNALNASGPSIDIPQEEIGQIIAGVVDPQLIEQIVKEISTSKELDATMQAIVIDALEEYQKYVEAGGKQTWSEYFANGGDGYSYIQNACAAAGIASAEIVAKHLAEVAMNVATNISSVFGEAILKAVSNIGMNLTNMGQLFSINKDALANLFKFNINSDNIVAVSKLISGAGKRTYESNLSDFGYSDINDPTSITVYANDFYAKERISVRIDNYNADQQSSGHEEKVISYTDYAKLLMSSITTMIDMITAVLVAFVAISLVVSSIMIGIITYISVLERRREIGILRAIGARRKDIFRVFNAETFIIGIVAGLIGIIVTLIFCVPANIIAKAIFNVEYDIAILPFWSAVMLVVISFILTFIAGLIPSSSAAKKDPVEAINS